LVTTVTTTLHELETRLTFADWPQYPLSAHDARHVWLVTAHVAGHPT
jgi:hypothetical protein